MANERTAIVERLRVAVPPAHMLQLHRNTRVDPYPENWLKNVVQQLGRVPLHRYPDLNGFHARLATFLNVARESLLITSGVDGALRAVFESLAPAGSTVVFLEPTYMMYHVYARAYGVKVETVCSDNDFQVDPQNIIDRLSSKVSVLFLANPHEPVEHFFNFSDLTPIIEQAARKGITVVIDEAYYGFGGVTALPLLANHHNLLIARSFSKAFGLPSIRLGCLVGSSAKISRLSSRRLAYETNSFSVAIAQWAIEHPERFEAYATEVRDVRVWLKTRLRLRGFNVHGRWSNTVLVEVGDALAVARKFEECGILVRAMPYPAAEWISVTISAKRKVMRRFIALLLLFCKKPSRPLRA